MNKFFGVKIRVLTGSFSMDGSSVLTRRYVTNSSIYVIPDPFIFWFK